MSSNVLLEAVNFFDVTVEFTGGAEFLVKAKKEKVTLPPFSTLKTLMKIVHDSLVTDKARIGMLFSPDATEVAHGVIVLINDTDIKLLSDYETHLEKNDTVTFVSTLHGG